MQRLGVVFCLYRMSLKAQTVMMGDALGNTQKFLERFYTDVLTFRASTFKLSTMRKDNGHSLGPLQTM